MFGLFKSKRGRHREPFETYMMECIREDSSISVEEVLEQYIQKYDLAVRHHLDERRHLSIRPQAVRGVLSHRERVGRLAATPGRLPGLPRWDGLDEDDRPRRRG